MLRRTFVAFDYYIGNLSIANPTFSIAGYCEALGSADYLDLSVQLDRITGTGGFDMFIEHSADGAFFAAANSQAEAAGNGDASFAAGTLSTTATNYASARAGYKYPLLAFVRLRFAFTTAATHAHVVVVADLRDREKDHSDEPPEHTHALHRTHKADKAQQDAIVRGELPWLQWFEPNPAETKKTKKTKKP